MICVHRYDLGFLMLMISSRKRYGYIHVPCTHVLYNICSPARKRQRLENCPTSKTCEQLLHMIGRGRLSIAGAVSLTNSMVEDGLLHDAALSFASLGCNGDYPANSERDMHRWLSNLFSFKLTPYTVWMQLQVPWLGKPMKLDPKPVTNIQC